jgi:hypothetical protein
MNAVCLRSTPRPRQRRFRRLYGHRPAFWPQGQFAPDDTPLNLVPSFAKASSQGWYAGRMPPRIVREHRSMTTAELIAKLKSDDPDGVREVVIWDTDEELIKGVARVELSDDRVVVEVAVELSHYAPA